MIARYVPKRLLVSFSGGETSAYMTWWIKRNWATVYDHIVVVFANTGEEWEATLEFVNECDKRLGFGTVWLESVQYPGEKRGPGFKVVTFETASRHGEPFEASIAKYGVPNSVFKQCTRTLKAQPIEAYARSIGWETGSYDHAIGIRVDEMDRQSTEAAKRRLVYPLIRPHPMSKKNINQFWARSPFRLKLTGYQGNCKWCWKKSLRKHFTIIRETPEVYDFPRRMEATYGRVGAEFSPAIIARRGPLPPDYRRRFFRDNKSVDDLFREAKNLPPTFVPAGDENQRYDDLLDVGGSCEESCEVFADEDAA